MPSYVVTGASRGLGYASISFLASNPNNTVIAIVRDRPATAARLARDKITNILVLVADTSDLPSLEKAASETARITGGILDILINNGARTAPSGGLLTLLNTTFENLEEVLTASFKTNVIEVAHNINAFLPLIRKGTEKKIVTISTGMADLDFIDRFDMAETDPYFVSKATTNTLVAR